MAAMPNVNFFEPGKAALSEEERALVERRTRALGPTYRLSYQHPVRFVRGEGARLFDADGNAYLDAYNNVPVVGHARREVVDAIASQAATLNVHTRYLHDRILEFAEELLATLPAPIAHTIFTSSGSEANDLACRLAEHFTGGTGFIATELAYHGGTKLVAELSPSLGGFAKSAPHVRLVPAPDTFRTAPGLVGIEFARHVQAAIDDLLAHGIKPAALLVDTIFASDGVYAEPEGFLGPAVDVIRKAGGLFIADEVQAGLGRTGTRFWGFERHGLAPDLVTMGKPLGNGYPMACVATRAAVASAFRRNWRCFDTFDGTPVAAAAGLATLRTIRDDGLQENARVVGEQLRAGLRKLSERFETIGDVRGAGLYVAAELVTDRASKTPFPAACETIVNAMRERRVLISSTCLHNNGLKIRPPLVFSPADADELLAVLEDVLVAARLP